MARPFRLAVLAAAFSMSACVVNIKPEAAEGSEPPPIQPQKIPDDQL
jgi:hypothetical protein